MFDQYLMEVKKTRNFLFLGWNVFGLKSQKNHGVLEINHYALINFSIYLRKYKSLWRDESSLSTKCEKDRDFFHPDKIHDVGFGHVVNTRGELCDLVY